MNTMKKKTLEERLAILEARVHHADAALFDLGMRPVHYPGKTRETYEWMHRKNPGLAELPHPVEGSVFIKLGFLDQYPAEVISLLDPTEDDIADFLAMVGTHAFRAWQRGGLSERVAIQKWIPEIVASRGDYGTCNPKAARTWAERIITELTAQ